MTLFDKLRTIGSPFKSKPTAEPTPHGAPANTAPSAPAPAQAKDPRFDQAVALHQSGQLAQAQALYEEVLRAKPDHADAWHFLGLIGIQSNDPQRAVVRIGKAIAINPTNAVYYINYGNALRTLQRQAPPILIWRYLTEQCGVPADEVAVYADLKTHRDFPLPAAFHTPL